jgi:DNA polymerase-4
VRPVIFHIDVNSAFLSWEAVHRLKNLGGTVDLREIASAVGGDVAKRRGIVLAKSPLAKKCGVYTSQTIVEALRCCPELTIVPPNYNLYRKCSQAFLEILRQYSPCVEQYSIDEAFVDMTGTTRLFGTPREAAERIREHICRELGFTVNIGVSVNRVLAKMASDFEKPNRVHTLFPEELEEKLWPLPLRNLFFVGRATEKKLISLGFRTIGDIARADTELLRTHLKKHGEVVQAFARGQDVSLVHSEPGTNKGYGNSTTIAFDVTDSSTAKLVLLGLAETVGTRLREAQVQAEVISLGIKTSDLHHTSRQITLDNPTNITGELHQVACQLFDELWDGQPIRHLGIQTGKLHQEQEGRQLELFDKFDYERQEKLDAAVDKIRSRYGIDAVKRAAFLASPIDHLSGGISREKRTVDYTKIPVE